MGRKSKSAKAAFSLINEMMANGEMEQGQIEALRIVLKELTHAVAVNDRDALREIPRKIVEVLRSP